MTTVAAFEAARRLDATLAPAMDEAADELTPVLTPDEDPQDLVFQNAELLNLILRAAGTSGAPHTKRSTTARSLAACEGVCRLWRDAVSSERLWMAFANSQWRESSELQGVASWKRFCATRLALARPRAVLYREADLQLMISIKLESSMLASGKKAGSVTRRFKEKTMLCTTLQGKGGRWTEEGFFEWRDVPVKLSKRLAAEAESHGWCNPDAQADEEHGWARGLAPLIFDDVAGSHQVLLNLSLFRAHDQKMLKLFSSDACETPMLADAGGACGAFEWQKPVSSGLVVLDARLEFKHVASASIGEKVRWRFLLSARDAEDAHEDLEDVTPQDVLRTLHACMHWS